MGGGLVRNSVYFFVALVLVAIAGFWPSYFSRIHQEAELRVHLHGAAMSLWCLMLVVQSYLIRTDRRGLHRQVGKLSYALVPFIFLSTLTLQRIRVQESAEGLTPELLYFLYVVLSLLAVFVFTYALAIYHRRRPQVHMRYMACTALPLIDPIGARLLHNHLGMDFPMIQVVTFGVTDFVLLCLIVWDRKRLDRFRVFPLMLGVLLAAQVPTFFVSELPWWRAFAAWYGGIPLP
jgi:uncharacterized membrane protein YozB (DUF420 family)